MNRVTFEMNNTITLGEGQGQEFNNFETVLTLNTCIIYLQSEDSKNSKQILNFTEQASFFSDS